MIYGHLIMNTTMVKDLSGMSVVQLVAIARNSISKNAARTLSDHYPETLKKVYVVNAPLGVGAAWAIVKQFLDPNTASKVEFLGKLGELPRKVGDMSTMPNFLGGQVPDAVSYDANDQEITRRPWNSPEINAAIDQLGEQRAWDMVKSRGPQIQQLPLEQRAKVWLEWASEPP